MVPTIGRRPALDNALRSVRAQTRGDWTCEVVCDHPPSTAEVRRLVAGLGDARFRVLENARGPHGPSAARNLGLDASRAGIVAFLDDDDLWLPEKLALHLAEHAAGASPGVVYSGAIVSFEDGVLPPFRVDASPAPADPARDARSGVFGTLTLSTVSVSRACFAETGGFDPTLRCGEDIDLLRRLGERFPFRRLAAHPVVYREHAGERLSTDAAGIVASIERLEAAWGAPVLAQRSWARERLCVLGMLDALPRGPRARMGALSAYGRVGRPPGWSWARWVAEGIRRSPRGLPRLLVFAVAGTRVHRAARALGRYDRPAARALAEAGLGEDGSALTGGTRPG